MVKTMYISEIEQFRLEKAARTMCLRRNQNIAAEMGKVQYEMYSHGVLFSRLSFLLDSAHTNAERLIAKLEYDPNNNQWQIFLADREEDGSDVTLWQSYIHTQPHRDFLTMLHELETDPHNIIW